MEQDSAKPQFEIREDDLTGDAIRSLLAIHVAGMRANSPPASVYALDLSGLQAPDVTVWTVWRGERLMAVGALKDLGDGAGELKSMRTHPEQLRKGAASALLDHIITEARARGMRTLSLETGSGSYFDPALTLYRKRGFVNGAAFGAYAQSAFNQFLHLNLRVGLSSQVQHSTD
jgi:putative acetyltransferase